MVSVVHYLLEHIVIMTKLYGFFNAHSSNLWCFKNSFSVFLVIHTSFKKNKNYLIFFPWYQFFALFFLLKHLYIMITYHCYVFLTNQSKVFLVENWRVDLKGYSNNVKKREMSISPRGGGGLLVLGVIGVIVNNACEFNYASFKIS